jgi:PIN domain nuclease of toxin-antitoxin system
VNLLLDTHALLWWLEGTNLPDDVADRISDPGQLVVVSAASIWEATVKEALGKLRTPEPLITVAADEGFEPLPITFEHAQRAGELPPHHRDPFDRMLVAQAQIEGLTIVSRDDAFRLYDVAVLGA